MLEPQSFLLAIESPSNPNNFVNVARYLREVISRRNTTIPDGARKYFAFLADLNDTQINSDALLCIDHLFSLHMSEHYGNKTWAETYECQKVLCERFIVVARRLPELSVFAQAAAQWAIRRLLENKMKSKMRTENMKAVRIGRRKGSDSNAIASNAMAQRNAAETVPALVTVGIERRNEFITGFLVRTTKQSFANEAVAELGRNMTESALDAPNDQANNPSLTYGQQDGSTLQENYESSVNVSPSEEVDMENRGETNALVCEINEKECFAEKVQEKNNVSCDMALNGCQVPEGSIDLGESCALLSTRSTKRDSRKGDCGAIEVCNSAQMTADSDRGRGLGLITGRSSGVLKRKGARMLGRTEAGAVATSRAGVLGKTGAGQEAGVTRGKRTGVIAGRRVELTRGRGAVVRRGAEVVRGKGAVVPGRTEAVVARTGAGFLGRAETVSFMGRGAGATRESDVSVVGRRVISALGRSESEKTRGGLVGAPAGINAAEHDQSTVVEQGAVVTGGRTTVVRRGGERSENDA